MSTPVELRDDAHCFVCGTENQGGLKLTWKTEGWSTEARFRATQQFQGWSGIVHGGILATVLDEAMTRLAWQKFGTAVTAEMTVRYLRPAKVGDWLIVRGEVVDRPARLVEARATVSDEAGLPLATATGKVIKARKKTI